MSLLKSSMTISELQNLCTKMIEEGIPGDREIVYREKGGNLGKIDYSVTTEGKNWDKGKIVQVLAEEWF